MASLYGEDEKLDILPFWLPDLETDIRQDPKQAYEEEKKKLQRQKEIQKKIDGMRRLSSINEPQHQVPELVSHEETQRITSRGDLEADGSSDEEIQQEPHSKRSRKTRRRKPKATFLRILAGRDPKLMGVDSEEEEIELPPGVKKPLHCLLYTSRCV